MSDMITFDRPRLERLKVAYREAIKAHKDSFWFDEREYLIAYAQYLIEYLETSV